MSTALRYAGQDEEASRAAHQAADLFSALYDEAKRESARKAGMAAAQAGAAADAARERGDLGTEAAALRKMSGELQAAGKRGEAFRAAERARRVVRELRTRGHVESATRAVDIARDRGDQVGEALAHLTLGQALATLDRSADADEHLRQAERISEDVIAETRQPAGDRSDAELLAQSRSLCALAKELREAGRNRVAAHVDEMAESLDPGNDGASAQNLAFGLKANNVVQIGVLHGDLRFHAPPSQPAEAVMVTVMKQVVESTSYHYEDGGGHPVTSVHLLVEAFTSQAVTLRRLRPVVVRRIMNFGSSNANMSACREFGVGLNRPSTAYTAHLDGPELDLDEAFALGGADFPFHVTASDPEYFVVSPQWGGRQELVEWTLELDWSCLGQHGTATIGEYGPFLSEC